MNPSGFDRPRSVFCIIADHHTDHAVAEAACAGQFTHGGVTLALGAEPDWRRATLPDDAEWRIEVAKFYFGLDLAHAFHETAEPRFLAAWERLVRAWIGAVAVDSDPSDVIGRRIQNWIYAWDGFASAAAFRGLSPGTGEILLGNLAAQVRHLRAHLSAEQNHRTLELYALAIAALAFPVLDPDGELLRFAVAALHENLLADVLPDGVHRERSTHYHMITLRTFLGLRENARRFGFTLPGGYDARLERACEFALHCHRPDGTIPALSDADSGSYGDLLARAGRLLRRPDFLWGATGGTRGVSPAVRNVSFPEGGYFVQRSGWGAAATAFRDERFLVFDCGPIGDGGHGHYDLLHVEVAAGGRPLLLDPGRYTYSEAGPNWRRTFKSTAAHNTVCVDGLDQMPYQGGKPRGPLASARLLVRRGAPGLDLLQGEAVSPCYDAVHTRTVVFVDDQYWILHDRLRGTRPHRYDLRFHLGPDAWNRTTVETRDGDVVVRAPGVMLVMAPARTVCIESGWVAPAYGVKVPAPVVSVVVEGAADVTFTTLVIPAAAEALPPIVDVHGGDGSMLVEVHGTGPEGVACDRVAWGDGDHLALGKYRVRAVAAWLRLAASGEILAFGACEPAAPAPRPGGPPDPATGVAGTA
jgi:hypothetical protein